MGLSVKSARQKKTIDISDYYAVRIRPLWEGLKQESPAFWWLCIYVFLEYFRPQSIYPAIDVIPWLQLSVLIALVAAVMDPKVKWVSNTGNVYFLLFVGVIVISSVFAFMPTKSLDKINIIINWIILYFLVVNVVTTEKRLIIFMLMFLLINFKMSQHGFISYAQRGFGYAKWGLSGSPGWFQNAGDFGIQMVIYFPLAMSFILALRSHWGRIKRLLFYLMPFTALVCVIGSASRGAQLGLAAMGAWFLLKSRGGLKATLMILLVGWALYSFLPEQMLEEFHAAGEDNTSKERLALWDYGMTVVRDNPVLGVGYENWIDYCWYRYHSPGGLEGVRWCLTTHNTYLLAAAELGYPGLLLYVAMIILILVMNARTRRLARRSGNKLFGYLAHGLDGGIIAYIVSSFFFTVLYYPIFWLQLGMTVALFNIAKKQKCDAKSEHAQSARNASAKPSMGGHG